MINFFKKIFGFKVTEDDQLAENVPSQDAIVTGENLKDITVQTLAKHDVTQSSDQPTVGSILINEARQTPATPPPEPLLDPRNYVRPEPADFSRLKEGFEHIREKISFAKLPLLWSIKGEGEFQELTDLKNIIVVGAQSTGKTNFVNQLIVSILFSKHPFTVKLIIADSKGLEYAQYDQLSTNFLTSLAGETDIISRQISSVVARINALCIEMDNRYDLMVKARVRNIDEYNSKFQEGGLRGEAGHQYLPSLVLVIDDFGQYSSQGGSEIFQPYIRILTQGYKVGIYSIVATSQISTKGLPNEVLSLIASRVLFRLNSREDYWRFFETTKLEIPQQSGIFLYKQNNHIQMALTKYCSTSSIAELVAAIAKQRIFKKAYQLPDYLTSSVIDKEFDLSDRDALFDDAARLIVQSQSGSRSLLQRRMKLGYNRAGRLMDQLEAAGIVGPDQGSKVRDVLIKTEKDLAQQLKMLR